jgi:hypothetical protein
MLKRPGHFKVGPVQVASSWGEASEGVVETPSGSVQEEIRSMNRFRARAWLSPYHSA